MITSLNLVLGCWCRWIVVLIVWLYFVFAICLIVGVRLLVVVWLLIYADWLQVCDVVLIFCFNSVDVFFWFAVYFMLICMFIWLFQFGCCVWLLFSGLVVCELFGLILVGVFACCLFWVLACLMGWRYSLLLVVDYVADLFCYLLVVLFWVLLFWLVVWCL